MVYYDSNVLVNQMFWGVVGNYIIRIAKKSAYLPWINEARPWLTRGLCIFLATISGLGIEYTYSYTPEGVLTVALSGLTFFSLFEHVKQIVIAYIFQQVPYHAMKRTDSTSTVLVGGLAPVLAETTTTVGPS